MNISIDNKTFEVVDTKEKITIADSFVVRSNKIGTGNGEAKLYIGNNNDDLRNFFGKNGFSINCFLLKNDLQNYLEETKVEYLNPEQPYNNKNNLPNLWKKRSDLINSLNDVISFDVTEQTQIAGSRIYVNSTDQAYKIIRELSLPNITYISVIKLVNERGQLVYYFKLFADYFGDSTHPFIITKEEAKISKQVESITEKSQLIRARIGQGEYRRKLLDLCPYCPMTSISDDRILIASHIKPWASSNDFEKTDPMNGFMFTPTFDFLFDRGYISFTNDKKLIITPWLSKMTCSKLSISENKIISMLPIEGREKYLEYHRKNIFKS